VENQLEEHRLQLLMTIQRIQSPSLFSGWPAVHVFIKQEMDRHIHLCFMDHMMMCLVHCLPEKFFEQNLAT
jgi:hypothetical protein